MTISINDKVRVKLTDFGRACHRQKFQEHHAINWGDSRDWLKDYVPPQEDEQGWSEWVLWSLIRTFGTCLHSCTGGDQLFFEPTIQLVPPVPEQDIATERKNFEQWYTTHAFDLEANPIGCQDCWLQWQAWQARAAQ